MVATRRSRNRRARLRRGLPAKGSSSPVKPWARYLMSKRLWYVGTDDAPLSVLHRLKQPQPTAFGLPSYTDAEVRSILRAVDSEPNRLRNMAVVAVCFTASERRRSGSCRYVP